MLHRILVTAVVLLSAAGIVEAHHSRAMFDVSKNITYRGVVKDYRWQDPHSHIIVAVEPGAQDPSTIGTWDIEASAINLMTTRGWKRDTFKPGDPITVVAHPNRDGSNNILLFYVILPDGSRLYRAANRYPSEVEDPIAAAPRASPEGCHAPGGIDSLDDRGRGLVIGDMHGTVESPGVLKSILCRELQEGRRLVVAMELPADEQGSLDAFMTDASSEAAVRLTAAASWRRAIQDGRHSNAVLQMLLLARAYALAGAPLRLLAIDPGFTTAKADPNARDAGMAVRVRAAAATLQPGDRMIVFVGNVHARKLRGPLFPGAPAGTPTEPLGFLIADLGFLHLNVVGDGGALWTCTGPARCGEVQMGPSGKSPATAPAVRPSRDAAYDAEIFVGTFTASPPAAR